MPPVQNSRGCWTGSGRQRHARRSRPASPWWDTVSPAHSLPQQREHLVHQPGPCSGRDTPTAAVSGLAGQAGNEGDQQPTARQHGPGWPAPWPAGPGCGPGRSMVVPSLRWGLWAAAKASPTSGSRVGAVSTSGSQIESKPSSSRSSTRRPKPGCVADRRQAQSRHPDADLHRTPVGPGPSGARALTTAPAGVRRTGRRWRRTRPAAAAAWSAGGPDGPGPARRPPPPVSGTPSSSFDRRLVPHHHGGHHPGQALGPGRQQDAPGERVDRGAAHHGVVVDVAVDGGQPGQVGQEHQHDRNLVEVLGEPTRALGSGRGQAGGVGHAPGALSSRSVTAAHGVSPAADLGQVLVPARADRASRRARRRAGSLTTITRHACRFPPLGAKRAVSSSR